MIEQGVWIACPNTCEVPIIRKSVFLNKPKSGKIEITGLGFFTLFVNGKRITENCFTPAFTDYEPRDMSKWLYPIYDQTTHRILYLTYDLTQFLQDGENVLEIQLGPGWYRQKERTAEGNMVFGEKLKALFAAEFVLENGQTVQIASDGTETYTASVITYSNLFFGEVHDARLRHVVQTPCAVEVLPAPEAELTEQTCTPDRIVRTIVPQLLGEKGGCKIYDVGENISGWVSVTAGGTSGAQITLRFAENLNEDGTLNFGTTGASIRNEAGKLQLQSDTFICDAQKTTFRPEYVWHGFRYFDVCGDFDAVQAEVVHTDAAVTSAFVCGNDTLNWLYDAFVRTELDNLHGCIPSDCPHRERLGYTGDGQITAKTTMMLLDVRAMYRKWIRDILDCQNILNGHVQHTAPMMGGGGGPGGWGCAVVIVPDEYDRHYDDRALLAVCYPHMQRWIEYLELHCEQDLVTSEEKGGWCLGDWATLQSTVIPEAYVNTCYFVDALRRMQRIAKRLGYEQDQKKYAKRAAEVRAAIRRAYADPVTGSYCGGVQGADAYAVWLDLDEDGRALQNLVQKYRTLNLFDTGFLGTEILVDVLLRCGETELAYQLLTNENKGGYAYMKAHGATTLWEYFSGRGSHNHPMFGAPALHLFDRFLGIRQAENSYGYKELRIEPQFPAQLPFAKGKVTLPCGQVQIEWYQTAAEIQFLADIPSNATGTCILCGRSYMLAGGRNVFTVAKESS